MLKSRKEYNAGGERVRKTYTHRVDEKYLEIRIYRSLYRRIIELEKQLIYFKRKLYYFIVLLRI